MENVTYLKDAKGSTWVRFILTQTYFTVMECPSLDN